MRRKKGEKVMTRERLNTLEEYKRIQTMCYFRTQPQITGHAQGSENQLPEKTQLKDTVNTPFE